MDFVSNALFNGKRLRALTVMMPTPASAAQSHANQGVNGEQVIGVMDRQLLE